MLAPLLYFCHYSSDNSDLELPCIVLSGGYIGFQTKEISKCSYWLRLKIWTQEIYRRLNPMCGKLKGR